MIASENPKTTFYVRDASGNVMSIYKVDASTPAPQIKELPIYGSSRLGQHNGKGAVHQLASFKRIYEYSNHLGNVLATTHDNGNILSLSDYFPFGLAMEDRSFQEADYRYGFNGKENDTDLSSSQLIQDYGFRVYNPVIGKFLSVDPLTKSYPMLTPYQFASNTPIMAIDLDGLESKVVITIGSDVKYRGENFVEIHKDVHLLHISSTEPAVDKIKEKLQEISYNDPNGIIFIGIFSHGSGRSILANQHEEGAIQNKFSYSQVDELSPEKSDINYAEGCYFYLGGCNSGTELLYFIKEGTVIDVSSFAGELANATQTYVIAANEQVSPKNEENGNFVYEPIYPKRKFFYKFSELGNREKIGNEVDLNELLKMIDRNLEELPKPIERDLELE